MRFLLTGAAFFALAAPAFGRVPPDDPVTVAPITAANAWSDGPAPSVLPKPWKPQTPFVPPPCRRQTLPHCNG